MSKFFIFCTLATYLALASSTCPLETNQVVDDSSYMNAPIDATTAGGVDIGYRLILLPPAPQPTPKFDHCSCAKERAAIEQLQARMTAMEASISKLTADLAVATKKASTLDVDSAKIGRWNFETAVDGGLVIRDTQSDGKRYKFPVGGNSDMYKNGQGGEVHTSRIVFPTRWSIGEESVSYLVFRDRGVPGRDFRYAMAANRYHDV